MQLKKINNSQNGFSVVELLIVVVVLGVLLVIAVPKGLRMAELHRLDTSVSIIGNKLMQVRMDAIKRNRTAWLRLDPSARTVQMQTTDEARNTINVGWAEPLAVGVVFTDTEPFEIRFDSLGRLPGGAQTFAMREANSRTTKFITISPAGKVTVSPMH